MRHADAIEGRPGTADRARTLSYLFLAGAAIGAATLAFFPNPPGTDIAATWGCNGLAVAVGLMLLIGGKRMPGWAIPVGLALGTAIISLDIYFAGEIRTNDEMFYLWVAFFSFSFLRPRAAAIEMLILGASYGLVLALHSEPDATTRWMVTMGTLVIAGILIARLVGQLEAWVERSRQREVALRQAEERFRSTFEDAAVGMGVTDLDGRFVRVNDALVRLLGYRHDQLIGMHFADLTLEEEVGKSMQALAGLVSGRLSVYQTEKRYRRADGELVWVSLSVSLVRDDAGAPLHLIGQMQDITDRKAAERELADRALHDPLTRLPNRVLFLDRVQVALARIERVPDPVAVFFIDLDRFKLINDSLGHAVGDRMLIEVGERLTRVLRPTDTVSRFGGDEFTMLCENINEKDARLVADRIELSLSKPFVIDDRELFASASLGVSITRDHRTSAEEMLRDADAAMYRAKEQGRSNFEIFDGGMRYRATQRLELENDLRRAIERDELRVLYQPMVEFATRRIEGAEALLRWDHPRRGPLCPAEFIATLEESGLIIPVGRWVITKACRQAGEWRRAGHQLTVAVNLSPRQLADPELIELVRSEIERNQLGEGQLCLELTESAAVDTGEARLTTLKGLGVGLALDDFGTGFSSLNQIRRLPPVDALKIDRGFVEELGHGPADTAIIAAIIGIAQALELTTIAEGIESEAQLHELEALGCKRGQGFYFAKPLEPSVLTTLLQAAALGAVA